MLMRAQWQKSAGLVNLRPRAELSSLLIPCYSLGGFVLSSIYGGLRFQEKIPWFIPCYFPCSETQ